MTSNIDKKSKKNSMTKTIILNVSKKIFSKLQPHLIFLFCLLTTFALYVKLLSFCNYQTRFLISLNIVIYSISAIIGVLLGHIIDKFIKKRNEKKQKLKLEELKKSTKTLLNPNPELLYKEIYVEQIQFEVGYSLIKIADPEQGGNVVPLIDDLRGKLIDKLGYIIPPIRICDTTTLEENEYQILIREQFAVKGKVFPFHKMATKRELITNNIEIKAEWQEETHPITKETVYWIKNAEKEFLEKVNLINPTDLMIEHLKTVCINYSDNLFTLDSTKKLLEHSKNLAPVYFDNLEISLSLLRKILVNLIREEVSIKDIQLILQSLIELTDKKIYDADYLSEQLRKKFIRLISTKYVDKQNILTCIKVPTDFEHLFMPNSDSNNLILSLIKSIETQINEAYYKNGTYPVILCSNNIRLNLFRTFKENIKNLTITVLAEDEIAEFVIINNIANFSELKVF
ncbi:MAG: FHIPEP family type III secretion protein [bacterium]